MSVPQSQLQGLSTGAGTVPQLTTPSTGVGGDVSSILGLLGSGYGLYNSVNLGNEAQTAISQSNPFGAYRGVYGQQLLSLMQNPSSVTSLPGYQFLMGQGTQALDRSAAAPGGTGFGSGAEGAALETFGQGLADQFYNQQVSTLSGLAGANINPSSPASAIQTAGAAATGLGNNIAGLGNSLGNMLNKLFPSSTDPAGLNATLSSDDYSSLDSSTATALSSDYDSLFSGPSAAGGEAATPSEGTTTTPSLQSLGSGVGLATGLMQGTPTGYASAGISGLNLAASNPSVTGLSTSTAGSLKNIAGEAGNALGIYGGIEEGGGLGYSSAAVNAGALATKLGAFGGSTGEAASFLGPAGSLLGLISGIKQGGVAGYGEAALSGYNLYSTLSPLVSSLTSGGSAAAGAGAATAGANVAEGSTAAAGASGASLGALAGTLGAVGLFAAPLILGMTQPTVKLGGSYYNALSSGISAGLASDASPEAKLQAASSLSDIANQMVGSYTDYSQIYNRLSEYGITPGNINQYIVQLQNSIPAGAMPVSNALPAGLSQTGANVRASLGPQTAMGYS